MRIGTASIGKTLATGLLAATCGLASQGASAAILWGMDNVSLRVFNLDTSNGAFNFLPGSYGGGQGGLDFDASGTLYLLSNNRLKTVNTITGAITNVGSTAAGVIFDSFEIFNGKGYTTNLLNESLYEINLATGAPTLIGSFSTSASTERIAGLASDGSDIYGTRFSTQDLVNLNPVTGGTDSVIGVHGLGSVLSLAYADGVFWSIPVSNGGNDLYAINPSAGAATLMLSNIAGLANVTGLTAVESNNVPEPGSLALVGAALGALALRRRRDQA